MEGCHGVDTEAERGLQVLSASREVRVCTVAGDMARCCEATLLKKVSVCLFHRRFEGLVVQGKSPTMELLRDWGTTNSTVGELVDILKSNRLLAAASVLLPGVFISSW